MTHFPDTMLNRILTTPFLKNPDGSAAAGRLTALCLATAFICTWLFYLVLNLFFTITTLSHLGAQPAPSVGEMIQLARIGFGATRQLAADGTDPGQAVWLDGMFVLAGDVSRLSGQGTSVESRLSPYDVSQIKTLILTELNEGRNKERPSLKYNHPVTEHLRLLLEYLRLKNILVALRKQAVFKSIEGPLEDDANHLLRADPLTIDTRKFLDEMVNTDKSLQIVRRTLEDHGVQVPKSGESWANFPEAQQAFFYDIQRIMLAEPNPHLALASARKADLITRPGFTLLFFPTSGAVASGPDKSPQATIETEAKDGERKATSARYAIAMEVRARESRGFQVEARFMLLELSRPASSPIGSSRNFIVPVLHREPLEWGLRPIAVVTSEEQLASRFFEECEAIAKGADLRGIRLGPPDEEQKARYVSAIRYFLERRLAGLQSDAAALSSEASEARVAPPTSTLDHIIVWPRRFNGGTWWGVIQFLVVGLTFLFVLEFVIVSKWLDSVSPNANSRVPVPRELMETASQLNVAAEKEALVRTEKLEIERRNPKDPAVDAFLRRLQIVRHEVKMTAEELVNRMADRLTFLHYIVTALPLVGFLGTVVGLSNSLIGASGISSESLVERQTALQAMQIALGTAFDKSFIAFVASILCLAGWFYLKRTVGSIRTAWVSVGDRPL